MIIEGYLEENFMLGAEGSRSLYGRLNKRNKNNTEKVFLIQSINQKFINKWNLTLPRFDYLYLVSFPCPKKTFSKMYDSAAMKAKEKMVEEMNFTFFDD